MSETIVESNDGQVKGERIGAVYSWKGIPYAKPPLGQLRFRAPEPPEKWVGVRDATEFAPAAMQPSRDIMSFLGDAPNKKNEDCLYLNIWSPKADDKRRPVMVWIHGGSFISGSGSSDIYDGTSFATQGDVVVVTLNYRLGIMGFLHLGEMNGKEYPTSGNCGILDQVAALQWVHDNIEAFGGDPNNVTIFGESAGAMSVGVLLTLPSAKGLFNKAILQSGNPRGVLSSSDATKVTNEILNSLEIEKGELSKLEELPIEQLISASSLSPHLTFGPVIDGVTIVQPPEELLQAGCANDIPILIGTNKEECQLYTFFDPIWKRSNKKEIETLFRQSFGSVWPAISEEFLAKEGLSEFYYEKLMTINLFTFPAIKMVEHQINQGAPLWMYRFDWQSPVFNGGLKACHTMEIPFVWDTIDKSVNLTGDSPELKKVVNQMHQAWIAFAHNGNPNTKQVPIWPEYTLEDRATMIFNWDSRVDYDPNKEERLKWEKLHSI